MVMVGGWWDKERDTGDGKQGLANLIRLEIFLKVVLSVLFLRGSSD